MESTERNILTSLAKQVDQTVAASVAYPWQRRCQSVRDLLFAVYEAWWRAYERKPAAYQDDLERLNFLTGWTGSYAQRAHWDKGDGAVLLMPPKFLGGDPALLDPAFVASMSLNHAVMPAGNRTLLRELEDQQSLSTAVSAHAGYFSRAYAYKRFFKPRGEILHAYGTASHVAELPSSDDWPAVNARLSLYLEAFPTRSPKFAPPPRKPTPAVLRANVYVCALNSLVHQMVLKLLRPQRVLLAGRSTWDAWPEPLGLGRDVGHRLRQSSDRPLVAHSMDATSPTHGGAVRVVRTNFIRTVFGPNSKDELHRLGRDVLA